MRRAGADINGKAQSVLDAVQKIRESIAQYREDYGCEILTCDQCGVTHDDMLKLLKSEAKATYTRQYAEVRDTLTGDDAINKLDGYWKTATDMLGDEDITPEGIERVTTWALNNLKEYTGE